MTQAELHPAYADYEESDALWLGKAPAGWETAPMKHLTQFINGTAFKPGDWGTEGVPIIRIENLNGGADFNRTTREVPSKYHVKRGDLLFGWSGNRGTSFGPYIWEQDGLFYLNQHIFRLEGFQGHRRWFYWMLKAVTFYVEQQAHGIIGMVHITKGDLGSIKVPIPSLADQETIASFLDRETARLDGLVAQKEKLLALLEEKRASLITHAVTRGLTPHAPSKPSGIPWIGNIPKHWRVKRFKHVTTRVDVGIAEAATHAYADEGVPILRSTNVRANRLLLDDVLRIQQWFADKNRSKYLLTGDIVTVRTGNTGVSAVVPECLHRCQCFTMLISTLANRQCPEYFCHFLNSEAGMAQLRLESWGSAQENISVPILKETIVPEPPFEEQQAIAAFIRERAGQVESLAEKLRKAVELLRERRTALISAAVTGQIDVRNWKPAA